MKNNRNGAAAGFVKAGSGVLKLLGIFLAVYVAAVAIYSIIQYSDTKTKLVSHGMSDATSSLFASAVMLIALGLPAMAVIRIFVLKGQSKDWVAAMVLPVISWGIAQIPANFDSKTGVALRYCAMRPGGELFCLDRPGVDPLTKQPLAAMDTHLAERQFREGRGLTPKRITGPIDAVQFFNSLSDPSNPEPLVWVAKNDHGCYDLFDSYGVHSQTGDRLVPVTRELVREVRQCNKAQPPIIASDSASRVPSQPEVQPQLKAEAKNTAPVTTSEPNPPPSNANEIRASTHSESRLTTLISKTTSLNGTFQQGEMQFPFIITFFEFDEASRRFKATIEYPSLGGGVKELAGRIAGNRVDMNDVRYVRQGQLGFLGVRYVLDLQTSRISGQWSQPSFGYGNFWIDL